MSAKKTRHSRPQRPLTLNLTSMDGSQQAATFVDYAKRKISGVVGISRNSRSTRVYVRKIGEHLELLLEISPFDSAKEWQELGPLITKVRHTLSEFEGTSPFHVEYCVLEDLLRQHQQGATYTEMAEQLKESIRYLYRQAAVGDPDAYNELHETLTALRILGPRTRCKLNEHLKWALKETEDTGGEPPSTDIDPDDLKNLVNNWTRSKQHKAFVTWWDSPLTSLPPALADDDTDI